MVLDVSDTIVLCFILLLASLAPATINPTMVRQELQVTVARVTVVRPDWHHYSSRPAAPARGRSRRGEPAARGTSPAGSRCCAGSAVCITCWALFCFHLCRRRKKEKKKNPQNKPHQIGRKEGHKMVHVRC